MGFLKQLLFMTGLSFLLMACDINFPNHDAGGGDGHHGAEEQHDELEKGPHNGRMLRSGDFSLELAIFETGVPPEFRAWATLKGQMLKPEEVNLNIKLTRLGGKVDDINFTIQGDALRGDTVIYEPHSFVVSITASHNGQRYEWNYDNFEGRTTIEPKVAKALEIATEVAGPKIIKDVVTVYGKISSDIERERLVSARFEGLIKSVGPAIGDVIKEGDVLARIESNESLRVYTITAPISGVVTHREANTGEQTAGRTLFKIMDTSSVWANLSLFPADRKNVRVGNPVTVTTAIGEQSYKGVIERINVMAEANQSVTARVVLANQEGALLPGTFVKADIEVAEHAVELAVKRDGLQAFRDFTVVYAKIDNTYEVRMLELGRQDKEWIEVLGGLEPGTHYVSANSYVIKADIEKSGAAHDH